MRLLTRVCETLSVAESTLVIAHGVMGRTRHDSSSVQFTSIRASLVGDGTVLAAVQQVFGRYKRPSAHLSWFRVQNLLLSPTVIQLANLHHADASLHISRTTSAAPGNAGPFATRINVGAVCVA